MIESVLKKLLEFGKDEGLFEEMPIKDIDKSCCTEAETVVIDFDKTKDLLTKRINEWNLPKSCDALKILPEKKRIDFIEFKGWKNFIKWRLKKGKNSDELIKKQVDSFEFNTKICDSFFVLNNIVFNKNLDLNAIEKKTYREIPKNYLIVVDIESVKNPLEQIAVNLEILAQTSNIIHSNILKEMNFAVDKIKIDELNNLQKPIRKSCSEIDAFYQS